MPGLYYVLMMACINNDDDHQLAGQLKKKQNSICGRDLVHLAAPFVAHACIVAWIGAGAGRYASPSSAPYITKALILILSTPNLYRFTIT